MPGRALAAISDREKSSRAVFGAGMEVAAGGGDGGVAEGGLHQMNRRAAVQSVAGVSVAEPVGRDAEFDAGALRRQADDPQHAHRLQRLAAFPRPKYRLLIGSVAPQIGEQACDGGGDLDGAGLAAFAEDGDLGAVAVGLHIPPA